MAFDTSALGAYVENNSKAIALKSVASAKTAKLLIDSKNVQFGVKGSAAILKMDNDVVIQDGSSCSRNPLGTTTLSNKTITVKPIKDNSDLCPKVLYSTFFAYNVSKGNSNENGFTPEFAATIMDNRAELFASQVEQMIWKGDTSLTGTTGLKLVDGLVKQIGTGKAITATGAGIVEKLQSIVLAMPVEERTKEDFRLFVGEDTHAAYLVAMANKNIYKDVNDMTVFGTLAKMEPVAGLNGSSKVYAARISNFQLGLDGTEDEAKFRYSVETDKWYMDVASSLGVAVIDTAAVGVATV